jgi:hypothetical protein
MIEIIKKEGFEEDRESWNNRMIDYPDIAKSLSFEVGRKLTLEIEVTDNYLSRSIFALLQGFDCVEGAENLGFKVTMVTLQPANRDAIARELTSIVDRIRSGEL